MRLFVVALMAALLALSPIASAQSPAERDAARALGQEALQLFEQGRWSQAYDRFEQAHRLLEAPTLMLYMARCRRNMGELVRARSLYQQAGEVELAPDAPPPLVEARQNAIDELAELDQRIPSVQIRIEGAPAAQVAVSVDGEPVASGAVEAPLLLDPGSHTITAAAEGFERVETTVTLEEGAAAQAVTLGLVPRAGEDDEGRDTGRAEAAADGPWWPGAVALGVGVVGLGLGTITGAMAKSELDDIESRCVDDHCLTTDQEQADEVDTLATLSTVGFIVGGVATAAGVVLLIWRPGGDSAEPTAEAQLRFGPGRVQLTGRF